jgi:DNA polymerase III epsilon subunit-like protein
MRLIDLFRRPRRSAEVTHSSTSNASISRLADSPDKPQRVPFSECTAPRTAAPENQHSTSKLTPEQAAAGVIAKQMLAEFSKALNATDVQGLSRDALHERLLGLRTSVERIDEYLAQHKFIEWSNRDYVCSLLDEIQVRSQPLHRSQYEDSTLVAVVDTETTGLAESDEPVSVAVILLDVSGRKGDTIVEVDSFYGLREPGVPIHPLRKVIDSADLLVAHNAKFDRRMISKIVPHLMEAEWACSIHTLKYDWAKLGDGRRSLDALCAALSIERPEPHNALSDCRALISVLKTRAGTDRASTRMARLIRNAWAPRP